MHDRVSMALIPPFFTDAVVALGFADDAGKVRYVASGFFYGEPIPGKDDAYEVIS